MKEKKLSAYKLPERLEIIDAMPTVGDSGKVDKKVLKTDIEKEGRRGMNNEDDPDRLHP